jgi:TP901 family phage tail tape measure protein
LNNIQLNIVANAQFQQVYAEVAKLKAAMNSLQKTSVGGPFTSAVTSDIRAAQSQFDSAVQSTRAFTIQQVAMTDSVTKFGQQLSKGQLSLSNYYKIWRDSAKGTSAEIDALATAQARLNRSIAIADPLRPGYAKLVTDINGVVTAEEKLIFQQQALNTALNEGSMKLINFGKNTQWMGRQLTVGLTMPLAMFGASVSQAYLTFDQQMTNMLKVYGSHATVQSQQTLDTIRKQVTDLADKLARTLGVAMSDTVTVAQTFSSIGLEGQNLINATEATVKLQKLGGLAATQASNSMVSLQNVFKLQGDQIAQAVNFLNAAKHSTSTTMQDIVDALPRVGPIIQQMGGTYKDFAALLVSLKESGVPAAQGANAIKSMLASLINPTSSATKALSAMNINIKQIVASNQGNLMGMVQGLQSALNALPKDKRLQAIEQLFGKFQFARVTALLNNLGAAGSQSAKVLELYGQSNSQLAAVAQQELDVASKGTPAARFEKMKTTLQADLIPLGRSFLETFTKIGNAVGDVVNAFRSLANFLGPVASLLGKIFGGGVAGLIIIGPIIMLVGLFSNLIGNILRGANAIRMFKQGLASAGPGENAFLAGLHGMRNFYQELDTSVIAARNQMDLMPEAITSNAKAFEILRNEISKLTEQFQMLARAQTEAMGGAALSSLGTALAPIGSRFLPIVKKNNGGILPGFSSGGSIYDPAKQGPVVPGPSHINYDSVLGSVPRGGFVVNKTSSAANPQLKSIPRFNSGGNMLAMLTPGEIVIDPKTTSNNLGMLEGLNSGMLHLAKGGAVGAHHRRSPVYSYTGSDVYRGQTRRMKASLGVHYSSYKAPHTRGLKGWNTGGILGGIINSSKSNYGIPVPGAAVQAVRKLFGLRDLPNSTGRDYEVKGTLGAKLGTDFTSINAAMMGQGVEPSRYLSSFAAGGEETSITGFLKAVHRAGVITHKELTELLSTFTSEYKTAVSKLTKINDANNPIGNVAKKTIDAANNPKLKNLYQQFETSHTSFTPNVMTDAEREAAGLPPRKERKGGGRSGRSGAVKGVTLYAEDGTPIIIPKEEFKTSGSGAGVTKGFAHADSPALKASINKAIQAGTVDQEAYENARLKVANKAKEKNDPYMASRSSSRNSPHKQATIDGKDDANAYSKSATQTLEKESGDGRLSNFKNKYSILGRLEQSGGRLGGIASKLGGGGAGLGFAGMAGSMALGAIPNKIGGADISGAKGIAGSVASVTGMAAFIPGLQELLPEIAIGTALFGGIKWAFQRADVARKKFEQNVKDTYSKLEKTPDQFITKIESQTMVQDAQANSYKQLSIYGKVYGDTLLKTINEISSGSIKGKQLSTTLTALAQKTQQSGIQWNTLKLAIKNAGDAKMIGLSSEIDKVYGKTTLAVSAMTRLAMLASTGIDPTAFLKQNGAKSLMDSSFMKTFADAQIKTLNDQIISLKNPISTPNGNQQDALKKEITAQEKIRKNLQDQLKAMQDKANVIQQQNDYLNKQTDLTQQIKQAEITGNYITAAQLTAQQGQNTAKYKEQQAIDAQQAKVDAQNAVIDGLNANLQKLQDIATATQATATNTAQINALKTQIASWTSFKLSLNPKNDGGPDTPLYVKISGLSTAEQKKVSDYLGSSFASRVSGQVVTTSDLIKAGAKATGATRGNPQGTYVGQIFTNPNDMKKYKVLGQDPLTGTWSIAPVTKAMGGPIFGPGGPKSDMIPAMLSNGEYVINAGSVSKYGVNFMNALNAKRYANGGSSSAPFTRPSNDSIVGNTSYNINLTINASGVTDPKVITQMAQDGVMRALKTNDAKINKTNMAVK